MEYQTRPRKPRVVKLGEKMAGDMPVTGDVLKGIPFIPKFSTSEETRAFLREHYPKIVVSFSFGKDSLAALLVANEEWGKENVIPIAVGIGTRRDGKPLKIIQEQKDYFENALQQRIYVVADLHWTALTFGLGEYQTFHEHIQRIAAFMEFDGRFPSIDEWMGALGFASFNIQLQRCKETRGLPIGVGVKVADSMTRRMQIKQHGSIHKKSGKAFLIWDWSHGQVYEKIRSSGLKLHHSYRHLGRSFEGILPENIAYMKERYPEDLAAIHFWQPHFEAIATQRFVWNKAAREDYFFLKKWWTDPDPDGPQPPYILPESVFYDEERLASEINPSNTSGRLNPSKRKAAAKARRKNSERTK